ncbi:hypothetical protein H6F89_29160 [Cyanobacteria bacterium FACHB-63]|nr:hypothetical protein [Cyanobacteria bacterium FACHB-63]
MAISSHVRKTILPMISRSLLLGGLLSFIQGNAAFALAQAETTFSLANRLGVSLFQASLVPPPGGYLNGEVIKYAREGLVEAKSHSQRLSGLGLPVGPDFRLDALISETTPTYGGAYNSNFGGFYSRVNSVTQDYRSRVYRYPRYGAVFDFSLNLAIAEGQSSTSNPNSREYARQALLNAAAWARHKDISAIIDPSPLLGIAQNISSGANHRDVYNQIVRWRETYKAQLRDTPQL